MNGGKKRRLNGWRARCIDGLLDGWMDCSLDGLIAR